ncbi:hypothetical protein TNCV_946941 [Trichonephila clavipes]|nr:hypothetical protein TNCV_946941 [Trichonephila clavipes]
MRGFCNPLSDPVWGPKPDFVGGCGPIFSFTPLTTDYCMWSLSVKTPALVRAVRRNLDFIQKDKAVTPQEPVLTYAWVDLDYGHERGRDLRAFETQGPGKCFRRNSEKLYLAIRQHQIVPNVRRESYSSIH